MKTSLECDVSYHGRKSYLPLFFEKYLARTLDRENFDLWLYSFGKHCAHISLNGGGHKIYDSQIK